MKKALSLIAFSILLLVPIGSQNAFATQFSCSANMLGGNEVPPNASPGSGTLTGTYDDVTNQLSWNISWINLLGTETLMHFHGPAPVGNNAGVQVDVGAISGVASPSVGLTNIAPAQGADLLAGLWYINLHTNTFPGGELRGQVSCIADDEVVGGEIIPVEATSLILAGAQTPAVWMLSALSALGIGTYWIVKNPYNVRNLKVILHDYFDRF